MGADYLEACVPSCDLTDERMQVLEQLICEEEPGEGCGDCYTLDEWKDRLRECVEFVRTAEGRRDVGICEGDRCALLRTGGMSWGDDPTDAFGPFDVICNCPPLYRQLEAWAIEDRGVFEYVALHHHRHGVSVYPFRSNKTVPSDDAVLQKLIQHFDIDFEPHREEYIDVVHVDLGDLPLI